jgi:UTP:GlnB (protein PII) uridylyltransferase
MNRFAEYMPTAYGRLYRADEIADHAAIAARRGERLVHAETWQSAGGPLLCVVAVDRPGLLALVTDALLVQGMAIRSARVFSRELSGAHSEAVDFLELRALRGPDDAAVELDAGGLRAFAELLGDLVASDLTERPSASGALNGEPLAKTRVYFERQSLTDGCYLLVVDAPDSNGLLHAVSSALYANGMRILTCEIRTVSGRACDRFEVEHSSQSELSDSQLCDVQLAVLDALPSRR